ncbi:hypothetical protein CKO24_06805 [Rhodothalassium salexigens DSM 2132]|nr:hypothetical protein [Rhodothalassium salexigens DSM 2132]
MPAWRASCVTPEAIVPPLTPAAHGPARPDETVDDLLGGALRLIQPARGYRMAVDTVLLAAAVPARAGAQTVELGTGTGAAALAVAWRTGARVDGLEVQAPLAALARRNAALNGLDGRVRIAEGSLDRPFRDTLPHLVPGRVDHVFANPPYAAPGEGPASPIPGKTAAHAHETLDLGHWVDAGHRLLRTKGTLTVIHRADRLAALVALLHPRFGDTTVLPLWPRAGQSAKRVLVQARKGTRGGSRLLPGLCLHGAQTRYTPEAEAVLRRGAALDLADGGAIRETPTP